MLETKRISPEAISTSLEKAERYRLINETREAESICPEGITITDNAIIPLKERVVDEYYDPIRKLFRIFRGRT